MIFFFAKKKFNCVLTRKITHILYAFLMSIESSNHVTSSTTAIRLTLLINCSIRVIKIINFS